MVNKRISIAILSLLTLCNPAGAAPDDARGKSSFTIITVTQEASPTEVIPQPMPAEGYVAENSSRSVAAMVALLTGTRPERDVWAKYNNVNFGSPKFRNAARIRREYGWTQPTLLRRAVTASATCFCGALGAALGSIAITDLLVNAKWAPRDAAQNGKPPETTFDRFIQAAYNVNDSASALTQYESAKRNYFTTIAPNKRPLSEEDRQDFDKRLLEISAIDSPLKKIFLYAGPTALSLLISIVPRAVRSVASAQKQVESAVATYLQGDAEAPDEELEAACATFKRAKDAQRTTNLLLAGTGILALFCAVHAATLESTRKTGAKLGMNADIWLPRSSHVHTQEAGSEIPPSGSDA